MDRPDIWIFYGSGAADLADSLAATLDASYHVRLVPQEGCVPETLRSDFWDDSCAAVFIISASRSAEDLRTLLRAVQEQAPGKPVLAAIDPHGSPDEVLELMRLGVADFVAPPFREIEILPRLWRLVRLWQETTDPAHRLRDRLGLRNLVGQSAAFLAMVEKLPLIARCDAAVLINGETGTGKEVCARAIHYLGPRAGRAFIPVDCGAIPFELVENELFGHERAAYTGASAPYHGLIREAENGTLFLDEIDSLPPAAQVKLLRFLQEKEYRPLGSTKTATADVRVIAATNSNVESAVRAGRLREDLFYRLNVLPLSLPPLRQRRDDIPLLVRHFLSRSAREHGKAAPAFSAEAYQALLLHDWPGNVRELEHVIERALVLTPPGRVVRKSDLLLPGSQSTEAESFQQAKARAVARFERTYIESLLQTHEGNISRAARAAQKNRRAFWELIRKHQIDVGRFRTATP